MPCTDGGVPYPPSREEVLVSKTAAMLCGIVAMIESESSPITLDRVLRHVDWKEVGVTRKEFEEWYALHRRRDAERRAREKRAKDTKAVRAKAMKKLSPEEREALGLKW